MVNYDELKKNLEDIGITGLPDEETYPLEVTLDRVVATIKANGEAEFQTIGGFKQTGDTITSPTGKTIKVGDYVNYDPTLGANSSDIVYSSPASKTGAGSDQSFDAATYKNAGYGWRVLGVKNGKIRLISEEFVGAGTYSDSSRTYYTLRGQNGYINGINELNTISAIFGHGKGAESATSITVDDINAITGYDPEVAKYNEGYWGEYNSTVTYTRGSGTALSSSATNGRTWSGTQSTFNYYDKQEKTFKTLTGSTSITSTYYYYSGNNENSIIFGVRCDDGYYRTFTGEGAPTKYWLASDYAYASDCGVYWGLRYVDSGEVGSSDLCYSNGYTNYIRYGVRPVVSLKSDISLEWNDTAQEWQIQ